MSTQENNNSIIIPSNENSDFQPIRPYESLSCEEQQRVQELLGKLDDYSNRALSDFSAEAIETLQIASETLEEKTQILLKTCSTLIDIGVKASQKRVDEIRAIKANDQRFLVENAKRTTVSAITEKSGG